MPAGHDFDALLIGALYGELSAVEESRLQAHLAAHPSDQEIFRQLTATREAIRASAVLAVVEPPQAISALLLQEAARRVRGRTAEIGAASERPPSRWLRWLSSLMASPGLAAAAMAVLVVGVFGTLYLRNKHEVAEAVLAPSESRSASAAAGAGAQPQAQLGEAGVATGGQAATPPPPAAPPADPAALAFTADGDATRAPGEPDVAQAQPAPAAPAKPLTDDRDAYSVALDDAPIAKNAPPARAKGRPGYLEATVPSEVELKEYEDEKPRKLEAREELARDAGKADKASSADEAERLQQRRAAAPVTPAAAPKPKLEEARPVGRVAIAEPGDDLATDGAGASRDREQQVSRGAAKDQARESSDEKAKKAAQVAESRAPSPAPAIPAGDRESTSNAVSGAGKVATRSGAAAPASPPLAPPPAIAAETTASTESISVVDTNWAKNQHVQLVRLVRANKCSEAARVARDLAERAPRYYQDNLAGSSDLRVCAAAIRDQLNLSEQAKRKRAAPARADEAKRK